MSCRSYTAHSASPKASKRAWLTLGGPFSSYRLSTGVPVSSSVSSATQASASLIISAISLSRGGAQSSAQWSTAARKPLAHTCASAGGAPS